MQPSGGCQHLSGICNFHLFTYLYSIMIVLLYKCSLLGHTFFFLLTIFLGYYLISATFLTKQRMMTFWSFGCLSLTLILIIVCLQKEALLKAAYFLTSGDGLWNCGKKMMPTKAQTCPNFNAMERREKHIKFQLIIIIIIIIFPACVICIQYMAYAMYRFCVFSMHSGELAYKADGQWMSSTCSIVSYYVHSQSIAVPSMSITRKCQSAPIWSSFQSILFCFLCIWG